MAIPLCIACVSLVQAPYTVSCHRSHAAPCIADHTVLSDILTHIADYDFSRSEVLPHRV